MAVNEDLIGFVREALNRGLSRDEIRRALGEAGWSDEEVRVGLTAFAEVDFPVAVPRPRLSLSARETFQYLILFGTLYFAASSLGSLLFQFVNLAFPDPAWSEGQLDAIPVTMRWAIASLVIATPVFLYAARVIGKEIARSPLKRTSPVRRWLTYLTLAIAAGFLIGDATNLLFRLLSGEAAARFVLKALVIGAIAGSVFVYYLRDLRRDETEVPG
jgi:hypothetical protein